jgi:hypothetical protein
VSLGLLPTFVIGVQLGIARGRWLAAQQARVRIVTPPSFLDACDALMSWRFAGDLGEYLYLRRPHVLVEAIGKAEGVPSYGNMALARHYGSHHVVPPSRARAATAQLLHRYYRLWVQKGRPGTFLEFLRDRYAPLRAANDPLGLNHHWLPNVTKSLEAEASP